MSSSPVSDLLSVPLWIQNAKTFMSDEAMLALIGLTTTRARLESCIASHRSSELLGVMYAGDETVLAKYYDRWHVNRRECAQTSSGHALQQDISRTAEHNMH